MTDDQAKRREELRGKVSDFMAELMLLTKVIKMGEYKDMIRQGREFIEAHNDQLEHVMQLFDTYLATERAGAGLHGQLYENIQMFRRGVLTPDQYTVRHVELTERIAELQRRKDGDGSDGE